MTRARYHRNIFFGLVLHGNKIWFSEMLSITIVGLLLCAILGFMGVITANFFRSADLNKQVRTMAAQRVALMHDRDQLIGQQRIAAALRDNWGRQLSDSTMYQLVALVYSNSQQFGYDPLLMLAVINVEGVFNPAARGRFRSGVHSGALGLMQLKLATAQEVAADLGIRVTSERDLFRPEVNIPIGIAYLTRLITKFRSFKLGLIAYNLGPGAVYQLLSSDMPLPTEYYGKVLRSYYRFVKIADEVATEKG